MSEHSFLRRSLWLLTGAGRGQPTLDIYVYHRQNNFNFKASVGQVRKIACGVKMMKKEFLLTHWVGITSAGLAETATTTESTRNAIEVFMIAVLNYHTELQLLLKRWLVWGERGWVLEVWVYIGVTDGVGVWVWLCVYVCVFKWVCVYRSGFWLCPSV